MPFSWIPKGGAGGGLSLLVLGTAALLGVVHGQWRAMVTKGQRENDEVPMDNMNNNENANGVVNKFEESNSNNNNAK